MFILESTKAGFEILTFSRILSSQGRPASSIRHGIYSFPMKQSISNQHGDKSRKVICGLNRQEIGRWGSSRNPLVRTDFNQGHGEDCQCRAQTESGEANFSEMEDLA